MNRDLLQAGCSTIQAHFKDFHPIAVLVLGSGWSTAADSWQVLDELPFSAIPGLGEAAVHGHPGRLVRVAAHGREFLVFLGRRHWYEGLGWEPVAVPPFVASSLKAPILLLTNAAGGIRPDLLPGSIMAIDDHINGMGVNPLAGPHDPFWGQRFPDMTRVYDAALATTMDEAARAANVPLTHGIYLAAAGPSYETPAEIESFRRIGADAVGMSTVPEAILGHAAGLRVAALSCITNLAAGRSDRPLTHDEVLEETRRRSPQMRRLLSEFVRRLAVAPP